MFENTDTEKHTELFDRLATFNVDELISLCKELNECSIM